MPVVRKNTNSICVFWLVLVSLVQGWQQEPLFRCQSTTRNNPTSRQSLVNPKSLQGLVRTSTSGSSSSLRLANHDNTSVSVPRGGDNNNNNKLWTRHFAHQLLAEAVGTFLIVFLGVGAVMSAVYTSSLAGLWQVSAVWAIAVTLAIAITGPISGAHLNPAISISMAAFRSFGWVRVVPYCLAQVVGAIAAAAINYSLYFGLIQEFETANKIVRVSATAVASAKAFGEYFASPVTRVQAFFAETIGTAVLAGVVFALTHPDSQSAKDKIYIPPLIGLTVAGLICVLAPLTQAGLNPARDFGPRIVAYLAGWKTVAFRGAWIYIVGPILGALLGASFVEKVLYHDKRTNKT